MGKKLFRGAGELSSRVAMPTDPPQLLCDAQTCNDYRGEYEDDTRDQQQTAPMTSARQTRKRHRGVNGFTVRLILWRQQYTCLLCRQFPGPDWQVDHWVPLSEGGTDTDENYSILCSACHGIKTVREGAVRMQHAAMRRHAQRVADAMSATGHNCCAEE